MRKREEWGSRWGFILAAVGSAVGLGNIWRFPYQVYENHGGAFLLPYFFALFTAGIPLLILEFGLGNKFRGGAPSVFARLSKDGNRIGKFNIESLGWFQTAIAFIISTYYTVIIGWTVGYLFLSFTQGWGNETALFFTQFLGNDAASQAAGVVDFIHYKPLIPLMTLLIWILLSLVLTSGIKKGIEKASKFFMPLLIIMIFVIAIKSLTLDGAAKGLNELFDPDFSSLTLNDFLKITVAAYAQIFYSLSVCMAIMIAYSSYLPKKSDITNNAFITGFLDCGFSLIAAIMIFAILGNISTTTNTEISDIATQGAGLAFITIPAALNNFPGAWGPIIGVLFFLSLTFAGLTSAISLLETVSVALIDKFGITRRKSVLIVTITGFALSFLYSSRVGSDALSAADNYINKVAILGCGITQIILVSWFFDLKIIQEHINNHSDFKIKRWWNFCIRYFTPLILVILMIINIVTGFAEQNSNPTLNIIFGWFMILLLIILSLVLSRAKGSKGHLLVNHETDDKKEIK